MQPDHFSERMEAVRKRFASSLESRINDTYAELPVMLAVGANAVEAVANAYRRIHGICGIGRAVGFPATGLAARDVQLALHDAYSGKRGLAAPELARLEKTLDVLTAAAQAELRSTSTLSAAKNEG